MSEHKRTIIEIDKAGHLYFLINSAIGAYNRRTDTMREPIETQKRIDAEVKSLKAINDSLEGAVKSANGK